MGVRSGGWCLWIFSMGLTALFLWLIFRTYPPVCSIEEFNISGLTKTSAAATTTTTTTTRISSHTVVHYDLKIKNKNDFKQIYYDALNLRFYYASYLIRNATYPPFHQGHKKSTHRTGSFEANRWVNGTAVVFRAELATKVRYTFYFWKTKRRRLVLVVDLLVNDKGRLVKRENDKGIKLHSGVTKINGCVNLLSILGITLVLVVHF